MIADSPYDEQESPFKTGGFLGKQNLGAERKKSGPTDYYLSINYLLRYS